MGKSKDQFLPLKSACCYEKKRETNNEQAKTTSRHSTNIEHKLYVTHWAAQGRVHGKNEQSHKHLCVIP